MNWLKRSFFIRGIAVCLLAGCSSEFNHLSQTQRDAIKQIQDRGGSVGLDDKGNVTAVNMCGTHEQIENYGFETLASFPSLTRIFLNRNCTDTDLKQIALSSTLEEIWLGSSNPKLTDAGLLELCALRSLKFIQVSAPKISDGAFDQLSERFPDCTIER